MTENNRTPSGLIKFWTAITLAGVLGILGPWLQAFFNIKLISEYFQPRVNEAASVMAALAFVTACAYFRKFGRDRLRRVLKISFIALVVCFVISLAIDLTLGDVIALGRLGTKLVWLVWIVAYISIFMNIALTLCIVGFLSE
jgi:hypothetical protein